jgi:phosphatidylglycerophosphate synthase
VFRPLSNVIVPVLARLRVSPPAVVLLNATVGLVAALFLASDELVVAAVLLQVKTLLDNCDGQLARATDRVTLVGRYLDTEADLAVNAAVFAALGSVTGQWALAAAAFVALTIVLAVDFNVTEMYREANAVAQPVLLATGSATERLLVRIYALVFGPLDRLVRALFARADIDRLTVIVLANLGLSTQLLVLGVCLVVDVPAVYPWIVLGCLVAVAFVRLWTERRARSVL